MKAMLFVLVILFLVPAIFSSLAEAHDPSEAGNNAYAHQLPPPWPYHAAMVLAGFIFLTGGAFTTRYLKQRKGWIKLHKNLALTGVVLVLAGLSIAIYMVSVYMDSFFVKEPHAYLGLSVFGFIVATPAFGYLQFRSEDKRIRPIHKWSGRITIMLMLLTMLIGVQMVLAMLAH